MNRLNQKVTVIYTRNDVFEWQKSPRIDNCILTKFPYDVGGTYGFETTINGGLKQFYINPNCSDFLGYEIKGD